MHLLEDERRLGEHGEEVGGVAELEALGVVERHLQVLPPLPVARPELLALRRWGAQVKKCSSSERRCNNLKCFQGQLKTL